MDKPLAELAACFQSKSRLPDQALVQLTAAARAAGSRWDDIAAACGDPDLPRPGRRWSTGFPARPVRTAVLRHPARGCTAHRQRQRLLRR